MFADGPVYGGIDAGGGTFKCILGSSPDDIRAEYAVPVTTPLETLTACSTFFEQACSRNKIACLGIACFGPVDLSPQSRSYGHITSTPKSGWQQVDVVGHFRRALQLPVAFETDVNGALQGEARWGAAQGLHSAAYVTIGTGVGCGIMMDGRLVHGAMHIEAGHMLVPRVAGDDFTGCCPFHGDCLEGLISGPALARRTGRDPALLEDSHPVWHTQAAYMAVMCVNLALMYSPQRIVLGGGVMTRRGLLDDIRQGFKARINQYPGPVDSESFIVPAGLGHRAGALGALALASSHLCDRGRDCV